VAHYPELHVQRPHGEPLRFTLDKDIVSIGRSSQNDLALDDHWLSRRHAEVRAERGEYFIQDLNSRNGTTVNGVPIGRLALRAGDVIRLGDHTLTFVQASSGSVVLTEDAGELDVTTTVVVPTEKLLADRSGETWKAMRAPAEAIPEIAAPRALRLWRLLNSLLDKLAGRAKEERAPRDVEGRTFAGPRVVAEGVLKQNMFLAALNQANLALISDRPLQDFLDFILEQVFKAVPAERAALMLTRGGDQTPR